MASQNKAAIRSVFFDIDGTLVDSNDKHAQAWVDTFAEFGRHDTFEEVRALIGMGADKLLAELGIDMHVEEALGKAMTARRKAIFLDRYVRDVGGFPGSRELVQAFKQRNLQCVVASSASPEELGPLLGAAGVTELFDHAVTPDEVDATKPDPDVILAALHWSKKKPEEALMIGDTSYDIEAAHRAGVRCIGLRCGGAPDRSLQGADAIFDSPLALLTALQTTPVDSLLARGPSDSHDKA